MELRQLRYFAEVVEVGSFLGAANRLDTAQPSLWRQVKALEKELGVPLFERAGRRVKASAAGQLLLPLAEQVLADTDRLRALATEIAHGRAGIVTIACAYPLLLRFLAPLIGGFHAVRPDIHVAIHGSPGIPPIDLVITGDADFVTSPPILDRRLRGHLLGQARIVLVTPEDHPWRDRSTVEVSELAEVSVLVGPGLSLTRTLLAPALRARGMELDIFYESHDMASLIALAQAGLAIAVVSDHNLSGDTAPRGDDGHGFVVRPVDPIDGRVHDWPVLCDGETEMATEIWIYWSASRALSPAVEQFASHVCRSV